MCKYYIVISDTLIDSWIVPELREKPGRKDWVTEKKYIQKFEWGTSPFWLHVLILMWFLSLFCLLTPFRLLQFSVEKERFLLQNMVGALVPPIPAHPVSVAVSIIGLNFQICKLLLWQITLPVDMRLVTFYSTFNDLWNFSVRL